MNANDNLQNPGRLEDLTVGEDQAAEVKGGPIYLSVEGVDGSSSDTSIGKATDVTLKRGVVG